MPAVVGTHAPGSGEGVEGLGGHFGQLRGHLGHVIVTTIVVQGDGCKNFAKCWAVDGTVNRSSLSNSIRPSHLLHRRGVRAELYEGGGGGGGCELAVADSRPACASLDHEELSHPSMSPCRVTLLVLFPCWESVATGRTSER